MPTDAQGKPIPCLAPRDNGAHSISVTENSARNSTAFQNSADPLYGSRVISVYSDVGFYFQFGDSAVTATTSDHYMPGNVYYDWTLPKRVTHIAVIRAATTDGTVWISEKV
jgi:hypothetical protein